MCRPKNTIRGHLRRACQKAHSIQAYKRKSVFVSGTTVNARGQTWVAAFKCHLARLVAGISIIACHACAPRTDFAVIQHAYVPPPAWDTHHYLTIADASPSSKGGVLIAGRQGNSRSWTFYVSGAMHLQWSNITEQGWPGYGAVAMTDARDGGFWVVGYGQSADTQEDKRKIGGKKIRDAVAFDYVSYVDASGRVVWQHAFLTGARRRIRCAKDGRDGLFVSGDESLPVIVDAMRRATQASPCRGWRSSISKGTFSGSAA
jgi:hypothetical protein